jgi:poly-gamma-glutamate synthesis protein (capsule biosynthesis protein)
MKKLFLVFLIYPFFICCSFAQEITLLFAGDAMQHKAQIDNAFDGRGFDYSSYFKYIKGEIEQADVAVVNLEAPLGGKPWKGYPAFSAPDAFAEALKTAGFDVFLTANNHCLDRRNEGLVRTLTVLDSLEVAHTGCFMDSADRALRYPLLIEQNGISVAMLNYTYATNGIAPEAWPPCVVNLIDSAQIVEDAMRAQEMKPDLIIANMHWGEEYRLMPSLTQERLTDILFDAGVDIVIGSHPHVVQPSRMTVDSAGRARIVVFSLGNLVSNMKTDNTSGGQLLKIHVIKKDGKTEFKAGYKLFFVNQNVVNGKIQFEIVPVSMPEDKINPALRDRKRRFEKNARTLFAKHNVGIEEY